jgi:hypothetical protein
MTAAHWTPAYGWHDCTAPVLTLIRPDGTLDISRPGCHTATPAPIIVAVWHHCQANDGRGRWERLAGTPAGWGMPDAVTACDVARAVADRIRSVPGWGQYRIEIRRDGRISSTIIGPECPHGFNRTQATTEEARTA